MKCVSLHKQLFLTIRIQWGMGCWCITIEMSPQLKGTACQFYMNKLIITLNEESEFPLSADRKWGRKYQKLGALMGYKPVGAHVVDHSDCIRSLKKIRS